MPGFLHFRLISFYSHWESKYIAYPIPFQCQICTQDLKPLSPLILYFLNLTNATLAEKEDKLWEVFRFQSNKVAYTSGRAV
jgi:hypothetical protein